MIHAVIPAGGRSSRMGRPKLLLPLGQRTVLEHVIRALQAANIHHILVVAAPHLPELVEVAKRAGADAIPLTEETADMRATIEFGLEWIEKEWSPQPSDGWLLVPADHPLLEPEVVNQLIIAQQQPSEYSIFIPTYQGRRGHPTLIGWQHVPAIRAFPAGRGLNLYLREHGQQTLEVPVNDASILFDLDTPDDYEQLLRRCRA